MTITELDLKLLKSERLSDFDDGGGRMTGTPITDGVVNELFPDISQLDRTYGRVSLRKAYVAVQSTNTDTYLGAHAILTDPPDDPNVQVTLFSTRDWQDERLAAQNRIESYAIRGPQARWKLYGDHIEGQRTVLMFSQSNARGLDIPADDPTPEVGDVLMLSTEAVGYEANFQFIRMTRLISRVTQKFTDGSGDFYKDVAVVEIGNPLRTDFPGGDPDRLTSSTPPTLIRTTQVADVAQYFGVKPLAEAADLGALRVKVDSPFGALVPSAQSETPLVDQRAGLTIGGLIVCGDEDGLTASASLSGTTGPDYAATLYLGRAFAPGSLTLTIGGAAYRDDGLGHLQLSGGGTAVYAGSVDYATGSVTITSGSAWSATVSASATQAAAVSVAAASAGIDVTINNRAFNYVTTIYPPPAPGSVFVDFRALGKWYRLTDDGLGHLSGDQGAGSGSANYATGSVIVTCGALPDIDSAILYGWAVPLDYEAIWGASVLQQPQFAGVLDHVPVKPGTFSVSWSGGSATADANGIISGNATGYVRHDTGDFSFRFTTLPAPGAVVTLTWHEVANHTGTQTITPDGTGAVAVTVGDTPIEPGSWAATYNVTRKSPWKYLASTETAFRGEDVTVARRVHDDGAGKILDEDGAEIPGSSIDYATGVATWTAAGTYRYAQLLGFENAAQASGSAKALRAILVDVELTEVFQGGTLLTTTHMTAGVSSTTRTAESSLDALVFRLTPDVAGRSLIGESLRFTVNGRAYVDRSGSLLYNLGATTNSGSAGGSVNYSTGVVTLTSWPPGAEGLVILGSLYTRGNPAVTGVRFRAASGQLSVGQFQIRATTWAGDAITGTADNNGDIAGDWISGHVDWTTGVCDLAFGGSVLDADIPGDVKASSSWYDPDDVDETGHIDAPLSVLPESIRFDCVLVSFIPLDADILGVDTVRLPQDGRVPIYRTGNVLVVHHTATTTLATPQVSTTVDLGRVRLAYVRIYDALDAVIPTDQFVTDLDAGTFTWAPVLNLGAFTAPFKAEHRIEDMVLCSDVDIGGWLTFLRPLTHAYPAGEAFVSSALVIGDLQGRVDTVFEQTTWDQTWHDTVQGSTPAAQFNDTTYPITTNNKGSIEERWACVFYGATSFHCYGEFSGLIADGDTADDFTPLNPDTGEPLFAIPALGWGTGWSTGNVLRFNTRGANFPVWLARTTLQSAPAVFTDAFRLQLRGDSN